MTVVLDTNVLVAALVAEGLCREVVHRAIRLRIIATSQPLLEELENTLRRKFRITPAAAAFVDGLRQHARLVQPVPFATPVSRDLDDDVVLATAVAADAALIVTGNDDLLVFGAHAGIDIVSPRRFLEILDSGRLPATRRGDPGRK